MDSPKSRQEKTIARLTGPAASLVNRNFVSHRIKIIMHAHVNEIVTQFEMDDNLFYGLKHKIIFRQDFLSIFPAPTDTEKSGIFSQVNLLSEFDVLTSFRQLSLQSWKKLSKF